MEKTFTVAGTSNLNGVVKFRFANDLKSRIAVLKRNGHTEINLIELPEPMVKADAIAFLEAQDDSAQDITDEVAAGPALEITEEAIQQRIAEICENKRPRNERGHFIKMDDLRAQVIETLASV